MATWLRDVEAQVVAIIDQDSDAHGFFGRIESGLVDPLEDQDFIGRDFPYCGVVAMTFDPDKDEVTAYKVFDVGIRVIVADIRTPQQAAQRKVQDALAHLDWIFGKQRTGNRFSVSDSQGEISDVRPGGGKVLGVKSNEDDTSFLVYGEYNAVCEYRLAIT